jgi:2',3'-cyclic-nucleotide 2'-phosphodiesterase/3'-nucleotidase
MGCWILLLTLLGGVAVAAEAAPDAVEVIVLQTSDVHGHVLPWDYFREEPSDVGLARAASFVAATRAEHPHVILVDNGDTIQGTPLTYYFARRDVSRPNPMMAVMNSMGYDAMTVGNHEYNYGLEVLLRCRDEAEFPFLSANTYKAGNEQPFFRPCIVKEFDGVRVGILGLTTSNIPNWESPENYRGLEFRDTAQEAARWVRHLREAEGCHAVIVNTHEGFEADLETGEANDSGYENRAWALLHDVPGVDVVMTGHAHRNIPPRLVNGVLVSQPGRWGGYVTRIHLLFRQEEGRWILADKQGDNIKMGKKIAADPAVERLIAPYHEQVTAWIRSEIGTAGADFSSDGVFAGDNALLDLVHTVLRRHTGADMSMVAYLPRGMMTIPAGPITVRDIYRFYIYENTPVVLAMTGRDIRAALEHAARFYDRPAWDAEQGELDIHRQEDFRQYNFDTLAGASYAIDPTRPPGERVVYLERDGRPLDPDAEYTVAVTNYQAAGGGHYEAFKRSRVVKTDSADIRNLIIEYIQEQKEIAPVTDRNWHLAVPTEVILWEPKK